MALKKVLTGSDDFNDAGAPVNLTSHLTDNGDSWENVASDAANKLRIPTTGIVRCGTGGNQSAMAGARIVVDPARIPAGVTLDKPRFLITMEGHAAKSPLTAVIERVLVGIYVPGTNSLFVGGYLSAGASLDCGDTPDFKYYPVLGIADQGGKFSFTHQVASLDEYAGGSSGNLQDFGTIEQNRFVLYVDEYQMTFRYSITDQPAKIHSYTLYPKILRTLRIPADNVVDFQISPYIGMRQNNLSSDSGFIQQLNWAYLDFTPQEVFPPWEPLEDFFIAKVALDFQSILECGGTAPCGNIATPASNGPYLIRAPSQFTDVHIIRAAMAFVDNSYNGAFLTLQIGNLKYEIPPFTRFQLVMPTNYVAILISGGGWNATLTLTSKIIEYAYF